MLAEAMAVVDGSYWSGDLDRVIQATRAEFPDWGIGKCKQRAEGIMNEGKAKYYDSAVGWVRTARDIYLQHGRRAEWQAYLNGLLETHARSISWCRCCGRYGRRLRRSISLNDAAADTRLFPRILVVLDPCRSV